jgi:hypothetical protein
MSAWMKGSDIKAGGGHSVPDEGAGVRALPDCPKCKYGTLADMGKDAMACVDCGALYTVKRLVEMGILPKGAAE